MLTKLLAMLLLTGMAQAQTYFKIAAPSDWIVGLPAGSVIACGDGTNFPQPSTTSATAFPASGFEAPACAAGGLYVQESATTATLNVFVFATQKWNMLVTVPANKPPPPPPSAYATTCTTTVSSTGQISILLNATPSN